MKPAALIIVLSIITAFLLIFTSDLGIFSSFPPIKALSDKSAQTAKNKNLSSIYRTVDGGKVWFPQAEITSQNDIATFGVYDLTFDVEDSNIVYIGTAGQGLYKTTNNGQNWEALFDRNDILLSNSSVLRINQDRRDPDNIYVAVYQSNRGVFLKSSDRGLSFTQTYITELDEYAVSAIEIHPVNNNRVYLGTTQGGFFLSNDFGETWEVVKWITGSISEILIDPKDPDTIYVATSDRGLFRTKDAGKTWRNFSKELTKAAARNQIRSIQIDPINTDVIFLGVTNGVLKTTNAGETWEFVNLLIPPKNLPIDAVRIDPINRNNIYVGASDLIYKSEDGGVTWSVQRINIAQTKEGRRINTIEIDRKDSKSVYFGIK